MPLTLPLPDWMPWWAQIVVLILAILFGFAFLMMPFAVFGLKGRIDFLEAQLDDIHAELRMIATRLPEPDRPPAREPVFEEQVRPVSRREPSPTQTPTVAEPRGRMPRDADYPAPVATPSPRFTADVDPRLAASPRRPAHSPGQNPALAGDWTPMRALPVARPQPRDEQTRPPASDWDDEDADRLPRRPLRSTTLRDTGRDPGRDPGRDLNRDPGRDRSEPTLRWPPPR